MKKIKKLNINLKSRKVVAGLLALGMCLVVLFVFIGGILLASKNKDDLSFNVADGNTSTGSQINNAFGSTVTYFPSVMNLDETGALNTTGVKTDSSGNTVFNNNFYNNLIGGQIDYIYYGKNNYDSSGYTSSSFKSVSNGLTNTAIKWRVLAKGDSKYGVDTTLTDGSTYNNNVLLWSDYQIGVSNYNSVCGSNSNSTNTNYAFWGTSYIRALLNGTDSSGTALKFSKGLTNNSSNTGSTTAFSGTSYYSKIFSSNEINSVRYSATMRTDDYRHTMYDTTYDTTYGYTMLTDGVLAASQGQGYYLNDTAHTTSNPAAAYAKFTSSRVYEETSDWLFLLDYYDVNNTAYGFGDASTSSGVLNGKQTQADKLMTDKDDSDATKTYTKRVLGIKTLSSTDSENTYDYYVQHGNTSSLTEFPYDYSDPNCKYDSTYIKVDPNTVASGATSADTPNYATAYWLRNAGRHAVWFSVAMVAGRVGGTFYPNYTVCDPAGVRPAFNFNPENVIYATAATVPADGAIASASTASSTSSPAYKVYMIKSGTGNFTNYNNATTKPTVTLNDGSLTVALTNYTGSATVLLAEKDSSGKATGEVAYMGQGAFKNNKLTLTLPTGVKANDYIYTILFSNDGLNGSTLSEVVTGSYVWSSLSNTGNTTSSSPFTFTYTANDLTFSDVFSNTYWYSTSYIDNCNITWQPADTTTTPWQPDSSTSAKAWSSSGGYPKTAGSYLITVTFKDGSEFSDGTTTQTIYFTIAKFECKVDFKDDPGGGDIPICELDTGQLATGDLATVGTTAETVPKFIVKYRKDGDAVSTETTTVPTTKGKYIATAYLDTTDTTGVTPNYTFGTNVYTTSFEIKTSIISITGDDLKSITWQYENDGTQTSVGLSKSDTNIDSSAVSSTIDAEVTYDEKPYTITLEQSAISKLNALSTNGLQSITYTSNYNTTDSNNKANVLTDSNVKAKATTNADFYTVTATLVGTSGTTFNPSTFTLNVQIDQALIDLSNVKWSSDTTTPKYNNGADVTITLQNLPKQLTAEYSGNTAQSVNIDSSKTAYTARVTKFTNSDSNYVTPVSTNTASYKYTSADGSGFPWLKSWRIDKGDLLINWDDSQTLTGMNGETFDAPAMLVPTASANIIKDSDWISYTIYENDLSSGIDQASTTTIDASNIDVPVGGTDVYWIKATLKSNYAELYNIVNDDTNGVYNPTAFEVGEQSKSPVKVTVSNLKQTYTGQPLTITATADNGYSDSDLVITYYDGTLADFANAVKRSDAPTNAGNYVAKITLKEGTTDSYALKGTSTFNFVIDKATADCVDAKWSYDATNPYVFENTANGKTVYEPVLENMPAALAAVITYALDSSETDAGSYTVRADFDMASYDSANYEMPTNLPTDLKIDTTNTSTYTCQLAWTIKEYTIPVLASTFADITYDRTPHDLIAGLGLPAGWENYLAITVNGNAYTAGDTYVDAQTYTIELKFLSDVASSAAWKLANGSSWSMPLTVTGDIKPVILEFIGWDSNTPQSPIYTNSTVDSAFYEVVYTDTASGDTVDGSTIRGRVGSYSAVLTVPTAMGNNVIISCARGTISGYGVQSYDTDPVDGHTYTDQEINDLLATTFTVFAGLPSQLTRPTFNKSPLEITYTGSAIDVSQYLKDYVATDSNGVVMVLSGDVTPIAVNDATNPSYTLYINIDGNANYEWSTGTGRDTVTLTFKVVKAELDDTTANWNYDMKYPELKNVDPALISYKYYLPDGVTEIAATNLQYTNQYYVSAVVNDVNSYYFKNSGTDETAMQLFTFDPPTYLTIPAFATGEDKVEYNGKTHTFVLNVNDADAAMIEYDATTLTQTEVGTYTITVKIKSTAYAEWSGTDVNGTTLTSVGGTTDDIVLTFEITKGEIATTWDETGKTPTLELPNEIPTSAITYEFYDAEGNVVTEKEMVSGTEYTAVASLNEDYAQNYVFTETNASVVDDEFTFYKYTAFFGLIEVPKGFPEWQLIVILLCIILSVLVYWRTVYNVKKRKQIKEEQEEKYPVDTLSFGLPALLLTWLGIEESIWTTVAVVCICIFAVGLIAMLATESARKKAAVGLRKAEKDFKKQQAEEQKKQEEAEQKRLEKEEREAELRRKEEKEEAEQRRREEREDARLQQQMMMQRAMSGGGGGGGFGGGGGYAAPVYSAPPVMQQVPAQSSSSTEDIVARVVAALNPTLQAQQQQLQQQITQHQQDDKVKALEDKIAQQQQQLEQHQQEQQAQQKDEQFKELKKQFEEHKQEKQNEKFKALQDEIALQKKQQAEEAKLAEQQQLTRQQIQQELAQKQAEDEAQLQAKHNEERNQEFTKFMLERSHQAAKQAEDRKNQQEHEQIKALQDQIKQQNDLIDELRVKNEKTEKSDAPSPTIDELQSMMQKQLEQQRKEQDDKLAKQQAEFEKRLHDQEVQHQQELQAQRQDRSNQQIKALEEQLDRQKAEQAKEHEQQAKYLEQQKLEQEKLLQQQKQEQEKLLEQQKLEQERKLEQQRQEQEKLLESQRQEHEKKLEELKNQKDQAELLAELRSQKEPVKQDDTTNKILEEHSKTLEQIAKQQAEMQAKQQEQEQERLRQEQERQRKELERKVQEQADEIKELKAKNSTVPSDDGRTADSSTASDKTAQILEAHSKTLEEQAKTLEQIAKQQESLQELQKAKEDALRRKELEDNERQRELENLIKEQSKLLEELKNQSKQPANVTTSPPDEKTARILEQQSRTLEEQGKALEEQGKTLEQIARQQDKALERFAEQRQQKPYDNQYQQADLQAQQLAQRQAELQAQQLARQQAEYQTRELTEQNAKQQAIIEEQARQLAQQRGELQTQQLAQKQTELFSQQQAKLFEQQLQQLQQTQQTNDVPNDELKKDNLTKK